MTMKMANKKKEEREKTAQAHAALGIGLICIIIGLPLWWKATEVYRVQLPYSDIASLSEIPLAYTSNIEVISFDDKTSKSLLQISKLLQHELSGNRGTEVKALYKVNVRERTPDEASLFNTHENIENIDEKLFQLVGKQRNRYFIIVTPEKFNSESVTYIGKFHNIFTTPKETVEKLVSVISETVKTAVIRENSVEKSILNAKGARSLKPDKESMRSVRYNPGYDLTFTLTVPQPDILDVSWSIKEGIQVFLKPLADQIKEFTSFEVNSQMQFFTVLQFTPHKDNKLNEFYFLEQDLPQLINPIESTLSTSASNNPELNFIVYIPTRDQSPLYIRDNNGNRVKSNSFLSPRWGGVLIYNVPEFNKSASLPYPVQIEMKQVMEVFISQIRLLLNLNSVVDIGSDVRLHPVGIEGINAVEIDVWLRNRCTENLATSINTMQSLAQLLGQISNIVIKDDIGREVEDTVEAIKNSQRHLLSGNLVEAFQASKMALIASEKAFFDPSLLELLYFPEDQKFAIYIPLFLPISIPVITSVYNAILWIRNSKKTKMD